MSWAWPPNPAAKDFTTQVVSRRNFLLTAVAGSLGACGSKAFGKNLILQPTEAHSYAVSKLAERQLGEWASSLKFERIDSAEGQDVFEVETVGDRLILRGNNSNSQARALNCYLREVCESQKSWTGRQLNLRKPLPKVSVRVRRVSPYRYRYYLNYVTYGYTVAFWDWARWEKHLDWMALNGINLAMAAVIGQESVWQKVLRRMALPENEIRAFIPGIAFTPWWQMDNLEGWGGPLSQELIGRRILLMTGAVGMTATLLGIAAIFTTHQHRTLLLPLLIVYCGSFSCSLGAVVWVYMSEVFPTAVRAQGQTLGSTTAWVFTALIAGIFPLLADRSGAYPFIFFACMMALQFFVVLFFYPETKNVSLESMQQAVEGKSAA
jgi:hypothetical protein